MRGYRLVPNNSTASNNNIAMSHLDYIVGFLPTFQSLLLLIAVSTMTTCEHGGLVWLLFLLYFWITRVKNDDRARLYSLTDPASIFNAKARFVGVSAAFVFGVVGFFCKFAYAVSVYYQNEKEGWKVFLYLGVIVCVCYDFKLVYDRRDIFLNPADSSVEATLDGVKIEMESPSSEGGREHDEETPSSFSPPSIKSLPTSSRKRCDLLWSFVLVFLTITTSIGFIIEVACASTFTAPGIMVDIGTTGEGRMGDDRLVSRRMHIFCEGDVIPGRPVVMYEHGLKGSSLDWSLLFALTRHSGRSCTYDRGGYGWSDRGPLPRTTEQVVRETEVLFERANDYIYGNATNPKKLLMVGHSMAGFQVRVFADRNPSVVEGIVFADPVNPDDVYSVGFGNYFIRSPFNLFSTWVMNPSGIMPILTSIFPGIVSGAAGMPADMEDNVMFPDIRRRYSYIVSRNLWWETGMEEWIGWPSDGARTSECGELKDGMLRRDIAGE